MDNKESSSSPLRKRNRTENSGLRLSDELSRVSTFAKFPISCPIHPVRLAQAGFYYDGKTDEVECYICKVKHDNWTKDENPFRVHFDKSMNCPFVQKNKTEWGVENVDRNILKEAATNFDQHISENHPRSQVSGTEKNKENVIKTSLSFAESDFTVSHNNRRHEDQKTTPLVTKDAQKTRNDNSGTKHQLPNSIQSNQIQQTTTKVPRGQTVAQINFDQIGITSSRPRYPQLAILAVRQTTFTRWPKYITQSPITLSRAGFFYEGKDDNVRCFFCGGGLRDWEPEDDPWIEHARWFPKCIFLRQCKGDNFVKSVLEAVHRTVNGSYEADEQMVHANTMSDPAVLSIIEIGYSKEIVEKAIEIFKNTAGNSKFTAAELLPIVFDIEEGKIVIGKNDNTRGAAKNTKSSPSEDKYSENHVEEIPFSIPNDPKNLLQQDEETLVRENETLKQQRTCKVCLDEEATIVFLPCGHLVTCTYCSPALHKCPVCRAHIKGTVKAIIS